MSTDSTRNRIGLFGIFGAGNLGNECTLQALLYNLGRYVPNAEVTCICSGPEETASSYNVTAFRIRETPLPPVKSNTLRLLRRILLGIPMELYRWFKVIATLKRIDMLIMTGTGMLGDFGILPLDLHYDILKWSMIARLCRCKLRFVSVGVGPIRHPLSRCLVKAALALADYRSYRDSFSKKYLESINFDTKNDAVYPDLAFSFPRAMIPSNHNRDGQGTAIGVGLITYHNRWSISGGNETVYRNYLRKLGTLVTWLLDHEYSVRLLIGDVVYDHRVRQDLRQLLEGGGIKYKDRKIIDEPASSVDEVLSQLAATDFVVASRYHNLLLALLLTKPVVAISYHEKIDALMTEVGLPGFCQDIENISIDKLFAQLTNLEENATNLKPQIERKTEAYRKALDEQYERIFKSV